MRRSDIREFVVDALGGVDATVYNGRGPAVAGNKLPFIVVYIRDERVETVTLSGAQQRTAELIVEYIGEGSSDEIEDLVDETAEDIPTILTLNPTMSGLVQGTFLTSTELSVLLDGETKSAKPTGMAQLKFNVHYRKDSQ